MTSSNGRDAIVIFGAGGSLGREIQSIIPTEVPKILVYRKPIEAAPPSGEIIYEHCNIAETGEIGAFIRRIAGCGVRLRYVVICAGDGRFLGSAVDAILYSNEVNEQFRVNSEAPAFLCSAIFHHEWKHKVHPARPASVVVVSSSASLKVYGGSGQAVYAASKAALNMLIRHLSDELAPFYVNVNAVAPDSFPSKIATRHVAETVTRLLHSGLSGKIVEVS